MGSSISTMSQQRGGENMKSPKYKVFESRANSAFKKCIDAGYRPLTLKEAIDARRRKNIPMQWYDTATFVIKDNEDHIIDMKDYTPKEIIAWLKRETKVRPLVLNYSNLNCVNDFNDNRQVPGVLVESKEEEKKWKYTPKKILTQYQEMKWV